MSKTIWPLAVNTWGDEERAAAHRVIDSGHLTMGDEVAAFEREFAAYVGSRFAVMTNSGSSANLLAVAALRTNGWKRHADATTVVPAIAWATTYAPLHQHGLELRVVDVDPRTLNVTADAVREALTVRTELIVGCSVLGNPAPVDEMRKLADERGLLFIEDNCESMGAKIGDRFCGTFGHIGTFSMFFSHHISTGEGGMLVTDDADLYELALCLRAHGWTRQLPPDARLRRRPEVAGDYQFVLPGYNLRPTELAAAVGRVQLSRIEKMNAQRIRNWTTFHRTFIDDAEFTRQSIATNGTAVPFGFTLVFPSIAKRERATEQLRTAGIEYRMITGGCFSEHPAARHYKWLSDGPLPNARHAHRCGLFVGNHPVDLREQIAALWKALK